MKSDVSVEVMLFSDSIKKNIGVDFKFTKEGEEFLNKAAFDKKRQAEGCTDN